MILQITDVSTQDYSFAEIAPSLYHLVEFKKTKTTTSK